MQAELSRLEEHLGRALEGEAWHGPSVLEALEGVSAGQAAAHPVAGAHSIWELVLHLCGAYGLVLRRLGGDGRQLAESKDWPPVPEPGAENWGDALRLLKQLNEDLRRAVKGFPGERLDQPLVPESDALQRLLLSAEVRRLPFARQRSRIGSRRTSPDPSHRFRLTF